MTTVDVYFYPGSNTFGVSESSTTPIQVIFVAYPDPSSPIQVNYSISELLGIPENGMDYYDATTGKALTGTIEVPGGCGAILSILPYDDNEGGEDNETFQLHLQPGSGYVVDTPDTATITIYDNDPTPTDKTITCCSCTCDPSGATDQVVGGGAFVNNFVNVPGGRLQKSSKDGERPVLRGSVALPTTAASADSIEVTATMGSWTTTAVHYDPSSVTGNELHEFAVPFIATGLSEGRHDYSIDVKVWSGSSYTTYSTSGKHFVEKQFDSPFSEGWELSGWDRLTVTGSGAYLKDTNGGRNWFNYSSSNYYGEAGSDGLTLTTTMSGYQVTDRFGNQREFNYDGLLTYRRDYDGNETTYTYSDLDLDMQYDELTSVTDATGRTATFTYTGDLITSIGDHYSRVYTLDYDSNGMLETVTQPDPDGVGSQAAGVTTFAYDVGNRVTSYTNSDNETVSFTYGLAGSVLTREDATSVEEEFDSFVTAGVVDTSGGYGSSTTPASLTLKGDMVATYDHPSRGTTTMQNNRFGQVTRSVDDDGNVTFYLYDGQGNLRKVTEPDPDGVGSLPAPVTNYTYDRRNNLVKTVHPDSTTEQWSYHSTLNVPLTYINRNGVMSVYTYDSVGNRLSEQVVIGNIDGMGNSETDDVVTSYTYTSTPYSSSDPPKGLLASITDPLLRVTEYEYNALGQPTVVTYAVGTSLEASLTFAYDAYDRLQYQTDEIGRVTEYEYDALDRLVTTILPDPDGVGPLASPEIEYQYDAAGRLKKEIDPLNRETIYTYNNRGELTKVERPDHDGNSVLTTTQLGYNSAGLQTTVSDPLSRVTTSAYNTLGQLTSQTLPDPDGGGSLTASVTSYTYDDLGRIKTITDALLNVTTYAYANFGREVTITSPDPDGVGSLTAPVMEMIYDALGQLISSEDALGRITTYAYDELGRKNSETLPDPDGAGVLTAPITEWEYDKAGNLRFVTDPLGNVTEYQYDARHRLVKIIQPDPDAGGSLLAPETDYTHDDAGQQLTVTDPLDRVTSYDYDDLGRVIEITQPDPDGVGGVAAPVTTFIYDAAGRKTSMTDARGYVTTYEYDLLDNLFEVTSADPDGGGSLTSSVTTWEYDAAGQLLSTVDALTRETTYEYDNLGRTTKVIQPDPDAGGSQLAPWTTYTYDKMNNVLTMTDRLSHTTTYAYDNLYRQTSVTNANSEVTSYTYDAVGNRLTLTDPELNTTTWTYDALNRVKTDTNELNKTRTFDYDSVGNLTKRTDRLGRVIEYAYDDLHRRTTETWKTGGSTIRTMSYTYDVASQLLSAFDPSADYDYEYDPLGRVTEITADIDGLTPVVTLNQGFDANGNRTSLGATIGSTADFLNTYTYDGLNRQTQVKQEAQSGGNAVAEKRIDFTYNKLNQYSTIARYASLNTSEYVATSTYEYDQTNRLTSIAHAQGVTDLAGYDYTYEAASRITSIDSFLDGLTTYTHDDSGQLTDADHTGQTDEDYTYDDNGNRVMAGHTVGDNNQLLSDGTYDYEYDDEGNRTAKETIATGERVEYTWDHRNRLVTVTFKNSLGVVTKTVEQAYDVNNQWIRSTLDSNGATSGGVSERIFVYDGTQIAMEFEGATAGDISHRYLWGPAVDQLLADEQVSSVGSAGSVVWPLADHLGTVRDLATYNAGTDTTTVANHRRYDSFGNLISESNSAVDLLFGFTGRAYDESSGLQNNWNRWYDGTTGQWMNEDPIGFEAGDENTRRYVTNGPTDKVDPNGLYQERLTDRRRAELFETAQRDLSEAVARGRMNRNEALRRLHTVYFALHSPFEFDDGGWRNPKFWTNGGDPDNAYRFRDDVLPTDAIADAWKTPGYSTGCKKAAEMIQLQGICSAGETRDRETGDAYREDYYNGLLRGQLPSDVYKALVIREDGKFDTDSYLPGDRAWMKNPYFDRLAEDEQDNFPGEEGANVIAIGRGLFVSYTGNTVYDKAGLQEYVRSGFGSVPSTARSDEFQFARRYRMS